MPAFHGDALSLPRPLELKLRPAQALFPHHIGACFPASSCWKSGKSGFALQPPPPKHHSREAQGPAQRGGDGDHHLAQRCRRNCWSGLPRGAVQ
eukprot:gene22500-biopygen13278